MEKRILIDLGGCYPAKSKAAQEHAFNLGCSWSWKSTERKARYLDERRLFLWGNCHLSKSIGIFDEVEQVITAESFLEMTKEDVLAILKPEPKFVEVVRYRAVVKEGLGGFSIYQSFHKDKPELGPLPSIAKDFPREVIGYKEVKVWIREDEV